MVEWTQEQKDKIWHLYTVEQRSLAQIAQQMAGEGATRANIARLIGQINMSREAEVDDDLIRKKRFSERRAPRRKNERRVICLKQTKEEMAQAKALLNKARDE